MKYSRDQVNSINQHYNNLKQQIKLTNLISSGIQSVLIDKQIPENLLDKRNINDIENDEFATRALLNDYSNDLITKGNSYDFIKKLLDDPNSNEYVSFFINHYPKIKSESKNFRIADSSNMLDLVKRLYNKNKRDLEYFDNKIDDASVNVDIIESLQIISNNLEELVLLSDGQNTQIYQDYLNKIDAIINSINNVGNNVEFLQRLFKQKFPDIVSSLAQVEELTTPPSNINDPLPENIDPSNLLGNISSTSIQSTFDNISKQQTSKQTSQQTHQQTHQEINLSDYELPSMLSDFTDNDFGHLKSLTRNNDIDNLSYATLLSKLSNNKITTPQFQPSKNTKNKMYTYFINHLDQLSDNILPESYRTTIDTNILHYAEKDNWDPIASLSLDKNVTTSQFAKILSNLLQNKVNIASFKEKRTKKAMYHYFMQIKQKYINSISSENNIKRSNERETLEKNNKYQQLLQQSSEYSKNQKTHNRELQELHDMSLEDPKLQKLSSKKSKQSNELDKYQYDESMQDLEIFMNIIESIIEIDLCKDPLKKKIKNMNKNIDRINNILYNTTNEPFNYLGENISYDEYHDDSVKVVDNCIKIAVEIGKNLNISYNEIINNVNEIHNSLTKKYKNVQNTESKESKHDNTEITPEEIAQMKNQKDDKKETKKPSKKESKKDDSKITPQEIAEMKNQKDDTEITHQKISETKHTNVEKEITIINAKSIIQTCIENLTLIHDIIDDGSKIITEKIELINQQLEYLKTIDAFKKSLSKIEKFKINVESDNNYKKFGSFIERIVNQIAFIGHNSIGVLKDNNASFKQLKKDLEKLEIIVKTAIDLRYS